MARFLLSGLRRAERMAFPAVKSALRHKYGPTRALQTFRRAGGSIRTQRWYELWRATSDLISRGERLKYLAPGVRPDPAKLPRAIGKQMREYSFLVRVGGRDPRLPGQESYYVTVSSSQLLTREEIERAAERVMWRTSPPSVEGDFSYTLVSGQRAGAEGLF